jgi:hypothetical protein
VNVIGFYKMEINMKTLKTYVKTAFIALISLSTAIATENDTFGENVAKAVLFHWSPKPEHIKTPENQDSSDQNKDKDYTNDNLSD